MFDEDKYGYERGMIHPLDEVLSGEISKTFEQLLVSLDTMIKSESKILRAPSKLFFKYNDGSNTQRFVDHFLADNE